MSRLKAWWGQPDQFDWITTFLRRRGLLRSAQIIMAVVTASSSLAPLTILTTQRLPSAAAALIGGGVALFAVGLTVFWLTRWPSRRQSQAIALIGTLCIAAWTLAEPPAALAALACTAMAVTGGYIAFFHNPKILLLHSAVTVAIATIVALRLSRDVNIPVAASAFWLICFLNLSVPLAIWGMRQGLGNYAQRAEEDALTGLLNRRAFIDAVSNGLTNPPAAHTHLAVVMIDLDQFKRINDTHGHAVGDYALRAVAGLLREHTPADAYVCRAGGEEFLIGLTTITSELETLAARLCTAVAELTPLVTASIGTASAELHLVSGPENALTLEELITIADVAMYAAKRSGGNQVHHSLRK